MSDLPSRTTIAHPQPTEKTDDKQRSPRIHSAGTPSTMRKLGKLDKVGPKMPTFGAMKNGIIYRDSSQLFQDMPQRPSLNMKVEQSTSKGLCWLGEFSGRGKIRDSAKRSRTETKITHTFQNATKPAEASKNLSQTINCSETTRDQPKITQNHTTQFVKPAETHQITQRDPPRPATDIYSAKLRKCTETGSEQHEGEAVDIQGSVRVGQVQRAL